MTNKAGLLAKITNIFASHDISINAMVHKEVQNDNKNPDIFLVTSKVQESQINKIIDEIQSFPENNDKIIKLRIEELT